MDKLQLIASLNAQYAANRSLAARVVRARAAGFIETTAVRHSPALRTFVAAESRDAAA